MPYPYVGRQKYITVKFCSDTAVNFQIDYEVVSTVPGTPGTGFRHVTRVDLPCDQQRLYEISTRTSQVSHRYFEGSRCLFGGISKMYFCQQKWSCSSFPPVIPSLERPRNSAFCDTLKSLLRWEERKPKTPTRCWRKSSGHDSPPTLIKD